MSDGVRIACSHLGRIVAYLAIAAQTLQSPLHAQLLDRVASCADGVLSVRLPGGPADDEARARAMLADRRWSLMRRHSDDARAAMRADTTPGAVRFALVTPELLVTSQSDFPLPDNDGPMWAGRGVSRSITVGVAACGRGGKWGVIVAPTFWRSENRDFFIPTDPRFVPERQPEYTQFASPYHYEPRSLDLPRRLGEAGTGRLAPGVLAAWWRGDQIEAGFTTESEWWGPGLRNALLLSSNAAGVPRAYVRTSRPLRVAGELEAQVFLGSLGYSSWFQEPWMLRDTARSLSGVAVTWRPWFDRGLQFGAARLVANAYSGGEIVGRVLDFGRLSGQPNAVPWLDSTVMRRADQLLSFFAHWRLPLDGLETWLEWGRAELPSSITDLLAEANHSRAFTFGLQHARPFRAGRWHWRIAFEHTATNQTGTFSRRPSGSWYTSRVVPGGFSQFGEVLGASIGPGSVSQWAALDVAERRVGIGTFVSRIKWDDDSFYTIPRPLGNGLCKHDVSLQWGARGFVAASRFGRLDATVALQQRMNLYWQALGFCFANEVLQVDGRNTSLMLRWSTPLPENRRR